MHAATSSHLHGAYTTPAIVAIPSSPHPSIPLLVFAPILDSSPQIECRLHMYIAPSHLIPLSVPSHSQRGDLCLDCLDSH